MHAVREMATKLWTVLQSECPTQDSKLLQAQEAIEVTSNMLFTNCISRTVNKVVETHVDTGDLGPASVVMWIKKGPAPL